MCGRSRCTLSRDTVLRAARARQWRDEDRYSASYNCTPGGWTPVVLRQREQQQEGSSCEEGGGSDARAPAEPSEVVVQSMRWGLVPSFTKKDDKPDFWRMFNARSESVLEKAAFRRLVPTKRCLVLVDGFYEWLKERDGKQPYYIHLAGEEPLVFAGVWDVWKSSEAPPLYTYTILTTDSSKRLEWLHDRMPVILRTPEAQQQWLDAKDASAALLKLCGPYNGEDLVWHLVTRKMNTPSFQGPECCQELKLPSKQSFFQPRRGTKPTASPVSAVKQEDEQQPSGSGAATQGTPPQEGSIDGKAEEGAEADVQTPQTAARATAVNADEQPPDRDAAAAAAADAAGDAEEVAAQQGGSQLGREQPGVNVKKRPSSRTSGGKRKGGPSGKSPTPSKKAKPPGQQDITKFFGLGK